MRGMGVMGVRSETSGGQDTASTTEAASDPAPDQRSGRGGALLTQIIRPAVAVAAEERDDSVVGSWLVFVNYAGSGGQRTRGLATFTPGGCYVGSISAFDGTPFTPTPSRGTTLHGSWKRTSNNGFGVV